MRIISAFVVLLALVAGCGGGEPTAEDLAGDWFEAVRDGDGAALVETLAPDAIFVFLGGPDEPIFGPPVVEATAHGFVEFDDYDGDGEVTLADGMQAQVAFESLFYSDFRWDCTETGASSADCDAAEDLRATGMSAGWTDVFTVADGMIVRIHQPQGSWGKLNFWDARDDYTQWVRETHAEDFDEMFGRPPSEVEEFPSSEILPYMDRECIEMHEAMIDEYYASIEA